MSRMSFRAPQRSLLVALCVGTGAAAAEFAVACSSSSPSGTTCGTGTELKNGECVVAEDSSTGTDAATIADSGRDGPALDDAGCPTGVGTPMARIPLPEGGSFCIDVTEVTLSQYNAFLASNAGDTSGQPAGCGWNETYAPRSGCMDGGWQDDFPVACVNWCDAYAYCAWAGKNLCGAVANVLPLTWTQSQTGWACSSGGQDLYPYGNTFQPGVCQQPSESEFSEASGPVPVGSKTDCHGFGVPFSEVFDLVGNVDEWLTCDPTQGFCAAQLGDWYAPPQAMNANCSTALDVAPDAAASVLGVRCCADYHPNGM